MITLNLHFQCGFDCEVQALDLPSAFGLMATYKGTDVTMFFPTREIRDAVRDALLRCPGCVARTEVEPASAIPEVVGFVGESGKPISPPQPAVQAMDAAGDLEMPF